MDKGAPGNPSALAVRASRPTARQGESGIAAAPLVPRFLSERRLRARRQADLAARLPRVAGVRYPIASATPPRTLRILPGAARLERLWAMRLTLATGSRLQDAPDHLLAALIRSTSQNLRMLHHLDDPATERSLRLGLHSATIVRSAAPWRAGHSVARGHKCRVFL